MKYQVYSKRSATKTRRHEDTKTRRHEDTKTPKIII